jgi:hypothetical protein
MKLRNIDLLLFLNIPINLFLKKPVFKDFNKYLKKVTCV